VPRTCGSVGIGNGAVISLGPIKLERLIIVACDPRGARQGDGNAIKLPLAGLFAGDSESLSPCVKSLKSRNGVPLNAACNRRVDVSEHALPTLSVRSRAGDGNNKVAMAQII